MFLVRERKLEIFAETVENNISRLATSRDFTGILWGHPFTIAEYGESVIYKIGLLIN